MFQLTAMLHCMALLTHSRYHWQHVGAKRWQNSESSLRGYKSASACGLSQITPRMLEITNPVSCRLLTADLKIR